MTALYSAFVTSCGAIVLTHLYYSWKNRIKRP